MTWLVYNEDKRIADWVARQLKLPPYPDGMVRSVGVVRPDMFVAGVVYSNYLTDAKNMPMSIEMTIASIDKSWCTRHNLNQLFSLPFISIGVKRVQATCGRKAKRTRKFLERLGFQLEGIMREANPLGGDCAHYSMLKHECRYLTSEQKKPLAATSTRPIRGISGADSRE